MPRRGLLTALQGSVAGLLMGLSACGSRSFFAGAGVYTPGLRQTTQNDDASSSLLAPFNYPLSIRSKSHGRRFVLNTALDLSYPRSGPEGSVKNVYTLFRSVPAIGFGASRGLTLGAGPVLIGHTIWGNGQGVVLGNGDSTQTFGTPGYTRSAWILGLEAQLTLELGSLMFSAEAFVQGFAAAQKRNVAFLGGVAWKLGGGR